MPTDLERINFSSCLCPKNTPPFNKYSWKKRTISAKTQDEQAEHFTDALVSQAVITKAVTKDIKKHVIMLSILRDVNTQLEVYKLH